MHFLQLQFDFTFGKLLVTGNGVTDASQWANITVLKWFYTYTRICCIQCDRSSKFEPSSPSLLREHVPVLCCSIMNASGLDYVPLNNTKLQNCFEGYITTHVCERMFISDLNSLLATGFLGLNCAPVPYSLAYLVHKGNKLTALVSPKANQYGSGAQFSFKSLCLCSVL